ncbi:hypothetical protein [Bradyrhizobium tropiciagri]|uniref:hypothetical protein n=1 Tax=Bradyrhizobium tropiciagri TaxID=312253 RepID=UPI001FCDE08C|nr:hypothetical protein [Bradyrhizobium tropiciagri]
MTALMIFAGIILLLPGVCSLFLVYPGIERNASDLHFVVGCLLVACFGVALIWWAIRRLAS